MSAQIIHNTIRNQPRYGVTDTSAEYPVWLNDG